MALFRTLTATAVAMVAAGVACAQSVGLGTGPVGSFTNNLGYVIAGVATQGAGVAARAQPYDGARQQLGLTSSGDLAFSLTSIQELRAAVHGTEQFEGSAFPNLRAVARLAEMRAAFFVRRDSGINSIEELRGMRVPVGYESQATESAALTALLAAGGLTTKDVVGVEFQSTEDGMAAFVEGGADAMMALVFDLALIGADRALGAERGTRLDSRIKMLEIPEDPEAVAAMTAAFPDASVVITNPLEGRPDVERLRNTRLPGVGEETRTMAYDILISASTETDEDLVYMIVKALAASTSAFLVTGEPQYVSFSADRMAPQYDGVEYHPGAIRYYSEKGIWPGN